MSSTRLSRAPPAIAVCGRESGRPCSGSPLGELFLEAVAAAKPTPLGVCPAGGGDQAAGFGSCRIPPGEQGKGTGSRTIRLARSPEVSGEGHAML